MLAKPSLAAPSVVAAADLLSAFEVVAVDVRCISLHDDVNDVNGSDV